MESTPAWCLEKGAPGANCIHIGANPEGGEIQAAVLTENSVSDDAAIEVLLEQIEQEIEKFDADGAYDKRKAYDCLNDHSPSAQILIPPRKNARIWKHGKRILAIMSETTMFRLKTIVGDDLSARLLETQTTQALVRCAALNRMTHLGMPQTCKIA